MTRVAVAEPPGGIVTQVGKTNAVGPPDTDGAIATEKHSVMVPQGLLVIDIVAEPLKPL